MKLKIKKKEAINKFILQSKDLIKGYVTKGSFGNILLDMSPWQMVSLDEKTEDWEQWNADWFEAIGLSQIKGQARKIIKNRRMAAGILDIEDYMPGSQDYGYITEVLMPDGNIDALQMFYPLAPPILKVLLGEQLKRDNKVLVEAVDSQTQNEKLEYKQELVNNILLDKALKQKEKALQQMGLSPEDPNTKQQFMEEMDSAKKLAEAQNKYKKYRHTAEKWGQHKLNEVIAKYRLEEVENEAFLESLINAKEFWHIDMHEKDFKVELLDNANCFYHTSPDVKYVSEGDYFGWFSYCSAGDIINSHGSELKEHHLEAIKDTMNKVVGADTAMIVPDHWKDFPGAYYDTSKPFPQGATNIPLAQANTDIALRREFGLPGPGNTDGYSTQDYVNMSTNKTSLIGAPKMFRKMRVYWRSQRKIGWLTKIDREGNVLPGSWIDENFKVTVDPVYDNSVTNKNTKDNLIYGEHIDWTWVNEWRHIIKISTNGDHSYWRNHEYGFEPIYLDGKPTKFQFKGQDNPFECYPPVEGCEFKQKGVKAVSLIDLLKPDQITYNICKNKVPQIMSRDIGIALLLNREIIPRDYFGQESNGDPIDAYLDSIQKNKIIDFTINSEHLRQGLQSTALKPEAVNLSLIGEAVTYMELSRFVKEDAMELVGITRQRLGQAKPGETATGINAGVNFSEAQTEPYFYQHNVDLMPRVYQRILEACQYYAVINGEDNASYVNSDEENEFQRIEGLNNLLRDFRIYCNNKPRQKEIKKKLQDLLIQDTTMGATILEKAKGLITDNSADFLEMLREAQIRKEELEQKATEAQERMQKEKIQAERDKLIQEQGFEANQNELDRISAEKIASAQIDAKIQQDGAQPQDNSLLVNSQLKQQQINSTNSNNQTKLDFDKKVHQDNMNLKEREITLKAAIEQKKLAASLANQTSKDDKALNDQIAKNQGIIGK